MFILIFCRNIQIFPDISGCFVNSVRDFYALYGRKACFAAFLTVQMSLFQGVFGDLRRGEKGLGGTSEGWDLGVGQFSEMARFDRLDAGTSVK